MRLVTLLALLCTACAWGAVPVTQCWDGLAWTGQVDNCPVFISTPSGGSGITDTTANVSAVLDRQADTLYYYVQTATGTCPTKPVTMAAMVNGTGAAKSGSVTDVGPGFVEIPLTGLTAEQEYCVTFLAVSGGQPSVATVSPGIYFFQSSPWQQLAADPGEPTPGQDLELLNARFVGAGGSNTAGCGADHVNRCATLAGLGTNTPGTDIYLYSGTVDTSTTPFVLGWSGSPTDPVIIDSYYLDASNGNQATAYNEGSGNGRGDRWTWRPSAKLAGTGNGITIDSSAYVYISNIIMDGVVQVSSASTDANHPARFARWIVLNNSSHVSVSDSQFSHARGYNCMEINSSPYFSFFKNSFHLCGNLERIKPDGNTEAGGDLIKTDTNSRFGRIENNKFELCGHNCIAIFSGPSVIRHNNIRNRWDEIYGANRGYRNAEISARTGAADPRGYHLVELNRFLGGGEPGTGTTSGVTNYQKLAARGSIYRFNTYSNDGDPMRNNAGVGVESCCTNKKWMFEQRFYNNDVADLTGGVASVRNTYVSDSHVYNNRFINNVFGASGSTNRQFAFVLIQDPATNRVRNNPSDPFDGHVIAGNCFKAATANIRHDFPTVEKTVTQWEADLPSHFWGNIVDGGQCDAADGGVNLAYTVGSGSGVNVTVTDSHVFSDGNTLIGGDIIDIGGVERTILAINKTTNVVTVDASITWSDNAPVNLRCNVAVKQGVVSACGTPGTDW